MGFVKIILASSILSGSIAQEFISNVEVGFNLNGLKLIGEITNKETDTMRKVYAEMPCSVPENGCFNVDGERTIVEWNTGEKSTFLENAMEHNDIHKFARALTLGKIANVPYLMESQFVLLNGLQSDECSVDKNLYNVHVTVEGSLSGKAVMFCDGKPKVIQLSSTYKCEKVCGSPLQDLDWYFENNHVPTIIPDDLFAYCRCQGTRANLVSIHKQLHRLNTIIIESVDQLDEIVTSITNYREFTDDTFLNTAENAKVCEIVLKAYQYAFNNEDVMLKSVKNVISEYEVEKVTRLLNFIHTSEEEIQNIFPADNVFDCTHVADVLRRSTAAIQHIKAALREIE